MCLWKSRHVFRARTLGVVTGSSQAAVARSSARGRSAEGCLDLRDGISSSAGRQQELFVACLEAKCKFSQLKEGRGVKALQKHLETAKQRLGPEMASVPPKRQKNTSPAVQGRNQQRARALSAGRAISTTSELELDEAKPHETRICGKACPREIQPEEAIREVPKGPGPYFYISGSNGAGLVSIYCQRRGWQRIYDNRRQDYALKWCEIKCRETYYHFKEGEQLLYQIPNNRVLTSKIGLLSCLREQERVMKKVGRSSNSKLLKMEEFFPESFRLDLKDERNAFFEICKEEQIWICKPSCSNQGRGIFLLKNPAAANTLQAKLHSSERDLPSKRVQCRAPQARIVQRYIHQPLLLEGKKFDVRSYLLIACTAPYVLFFAQGYVRLTCTSYDAMSDDLTVHLTNQYMQKKNSLYSQLKDETVWRMEHFNSYVNEKFTKTDGLPKDWVFTVFTKRMQQIMLQCFLAAKHKLDRKLGYFDLIGCDFLIDENFKHQDMAPIQPAHLLHRQTLALTAQEGKKNIYCSRNCSVQNFLGKAEFTLRSTGIVTSTQLIANILEF